MMHWFLRMTDAQIARYINMPRRTVNTRRHKAYRLLKELMGGLPPLSEETPKR